MSGSDAIIVGESWISEHYFGSEATSESFHAEVLARRKAWDAEEKADRPTPRSRLITVRQKLEVELAALAELADPDGAVVHDAETIAKAAHEVYTQIITVLELREHGLQVTGTGSLLRVSAAGITERAPLAVILARPAGAHEDALAKDADTLLQPLALKEGGPEFTSAARLVSALFVDESAAPDLVLVLAGRWIVLAEQERWAEGRFLAVDLQLICERNESKRGGEIDRALTCLSAESVAPDAASRLWWLETLEKSVKHTVGVSKDLREGVRLSIEIIANEVVARRHARELDPLPATDANELAKQSLRFLYRVLFLLYAEASPELGVLPAGAAEYDAGYSLDRLRELVQVELATPRSMAGTHLYDSLSVLFGLVDTGHAPERVVETDDEDDESGAGSATEGLSFNALRADLFHPEATRFIEAVGLGNAALQKVLAHLLLSKERRRKDRGFISYAELGINQLGAVYEGLMSYTGFFAESDLYEVAKGGDGAKGSWVVPVSRSEGIPAGDFVKAEDPRTGEKKPVLHRAGSFVFRLAGRERQQSASYYTPEVLTRFTVGQALEELLDQDGRRTTAVEILRLTVCEPALGSGAFALEAVRQLADQYLRRRQDELGQRIDPDEYPRRLQEVKAYLALHNVYGVDLNATAVELAEISLWLDTMVSGLSAPWFGLHLKRGNSLIGARRAVYRRSQVADKSWLRAVPTDLPLTALPGDIAADRVGSDLGDGIHHFLLPADGWGAAADAKEAAGLVPDAAKKLKSWRGATKTKLSKTQVAALAELANRVEQLWQFSYRRLDIAEQQIRRSIPVWGAGELPAGGVVQRKEIEESLADGGGAYQRLRRVMDAWTALWFWPLTDTAITVDGHQVEPPTVDRWIAGLHVLLGRNPEFGDKKKSKRDPGPGQISLAQATSWDELGRAEELELDFAGAWSIGAVLAEHPWLVVCERVARQQGFFHWNLDFATVFARGGFDLQVGNPPWVRPDWDSRSVLSEGDPWFSLVDDGHEDWANRQQHLLEQPMMRSLYVSLGAEQAAGKAALTASSLFPALSGLRLDLYRCFMQRAWDNSSKQGISVLIHPESHLNDAKSSSLRGATYLRLRRFWHFINELVLFDIDNHKPYGVHVYGAPRNQTSFLMATSIYHPSTIDRSLVHDGSGPEPGLKDENGKWNLHPHKSRVMSVTSHTLRVWAEALDWQGNSAETPAVFLPNSSSLSALQLLSLAPRIRRLGMSFSQGWNETTDEDRGRIRKLWGPVQRWDDVILQGPHFFVSTPLSKTPNSTLRSNRDWERIDRSKIKEADIPVTIYKPAGQRETYDDTFSNWPNGVPARSTFRIAWRSMANNTAERTLIPALIPPGAAHLSQSVYAAGFPVRQSRALVICAGVLSSLLADFSVRAVPKSAVLMDVIERLPDLTEFPLAGEVLLRTLRLNCVTDAYRELWDELYDPCFRVDRFTSTNPLLTSGLGEITSAWDDQTALRSAVDRRQAILELDALVALGISLGPDQLCGIYRSHFPVLVNKDKARDKEKFVFDNNGRIVPTGVLQQARRRGLTEFTINSHMNLGLSPEDVTSKDDNGEWQTYELPFVILDREADMRRAYACFERVLAERS